VKNLVVVCLAIFLTVSAAAPAYPKRGPEEVSPFAPAKCIGDPHRRAFYLFSTSVGNYTVSTGGLVEVYVGNRKKYFPVRVGNSSRIERLYFLEYEGDLLLLYEAGASGYLVRVNQATRKVKSTTTVNEAFEPPLMKDQSLTFTDGTVVPLN
jgi:hypothetical protein